MTLTPSIVCAPLSVMFAVVAATHEAFASSPCATLSTYDLFAMSVEPLGAFATVPAVAVRLAIVPSDVSEEEVMPAASVLPESVPAAAVTVIAAVPSKLTPLIALAVCNAVAVAAFPVVDWLRVGKVQFARLPLAGVPRTGAVIVGPDHAGVTGQH